MEDGVSDVLGIEEAAGGAELVEFLIAAMEVGIDERGVHKAWRNTRDLVLATVQSEFRAEGFCDSPDSEFGGGIESTSGRDPVTGEGGDVDDAST